MNKQETRQVKNQLLRKYIILESAQKEFSYHDFIVDCYTHNLSEAGTNLLALEILAKLFEDNTGYLQDFIYTFMVNLKYRLHAHDEKLLGMIWENSRLANNNYTAHNLRTLWIDMKESQGK